MRRTMVRLGVLALGLWLAGTLALAVRAQQQPPPSEEQQGPLAPPPPEKQSPYALRVDVPVVNVDVTVVDRDGNLITNLRKQHFRIYQDGQEQPIVAFAPTEAPLTTVLLVESSPLLGYYLWDNLEAAYQFTYHLKKDDWVALVGYDIKPHLEVDFTHDGRSIIEALRHMQWGVGRFSEVNMFDALIDTLDRLKGVEGKKSIIVIGTGLNTFAKHTWDDAEKRARDAGVTIFCIGTQWGPQLRNERLETYGYNTSISRMNLNMAQAQMRALAEETGGRAFFPRFSTEMPSIYNTIGAMLRNQYSLAFQPRDFKKDGKYHKIKVKLVAPNGQPLKVINQDGKNVKYEIYAREGYYAPQA